jgi:hypothetical protein
MHPYDHARSSVKIHGGRWEDYFRLHAWFDASKVVQCRFTHRAIRHHVEGVREAIDVFGPAIRNSDRVEVDTESLGLQHLEEDCAHIPTAADWMDDFDRPDWLPAQRPDPIALAQQSARRFGGEQDHWLPMHSWFLATETWTDGLEHLAFRNHSFGIFEAEARFGAAVDIGEGRLFPLRVAAERHVQTVLGRVPTAMDFLRRIKGARWMLQAMKPRNI